MAWRLDYGELGLGALLSAICAGSILQIAWSGVVRGRMGGAWTRTKSAAVYWLAASTLAAGLGAGLILLAAGFGASSRLAAGMAAVTAAGALMTLARYGRATKRPK